jgi:hypothetical protein
LAFTERDGPGRPPRGPSRWATGTLAAVLGVTCAGVSTSDSLCADHRAWVEILGGVAFLAAAAALVGLWRGWAAAPLLTLTAGIPGVAIGALDAMHAPTRGRLITIGFAVVTLLAAVMTWRAWRVTRWGRPAAGPARDGEAVDRTTLPERVRDEAARTTAEPSDEASKVT